MTNLLMRQWADKTPSLGVWSNLPDLHLTETLVRSGASWICFDLQHGLMDYTDLTRLFPAIAGCDVTPLVRVAANRSDQIGKVLDVGAKGVIVPMVNTAEDARAAVSACRYPPLGLRSCGPMRPALLEGFGYLATANDTTACILMIETEDGLQNVEAIAAEQGVDALFIGPVDLCFGLGIPPGQFDHPKFVGAVARILAACKANNIAAGMFGYSPALAASAVAQGFDFVSIGTDISFVREGLTRAMAVASGVDPETAQGAGY